MRVLLLLLLCFPWVISGAQGVKDIFVDPSSNGKPLTVFLQRLEEQYDIDFIGNREQLLPMSVTGIVERQRLTDYVENMSFFIKPIRVSDQVIMLLDKTLFDSLSTPEPLIFFQDPKDSKTSFHGVVVDESGEPLNAAHIYFPSLKKGTTTKANGEFQFETTKTDFLVMEIKYAGYDARLYVLGFSSWGESKQMFSKLFPSSKELVGVTITAERVNEKVISSVTGIEKVSMETIKSLPTFMGEVDPIRSLSTLPGVTTAGELASGFYVRGGDAGQNLILQDGATIYNPSHLFGFFSAFNPDMISDLTLYKGGGPANFGSRLSSTLDIALKNGSTSKHTIQGGVGLVSSRLAAEGPLSKNKSSYMVGGRMSYANWLLQASGKNQLENSNAKFYDVTARIFQTVNQNNYLTLSLYNSHDAFKLETDSIFSWGTFNLALKWDHTFKERLFSTLSLTSSNYFSEVKSNSNIEGFTYRNAIKNAGLKYDITHTLGEESKILAGIESTGTLIEPGNMVPDEDAYNIDPQNMSDQRSLETAVYLQGDIKLSDTWSIFAGLRYSYFLRLGPEGIYTYDYNDMNGRYPAIKDTLDYSSGEVIQQFSGLEPRISVRYLANKNISLKASIYKGYQYLHLISNTTSTTPQDYWIASGPYLKPQMGTQYSLGYFQNMKENVYSLSVEGFYKDISNAVDYIEGADITLNPALEAGLSQGKGVAYGLEFAFKKNSGRLTGWLSYTYSRSLRKFQAETGSKIVINGGEYYPSAYDQPHIISLVGAYKVGLRGVLSANFNYSTGRPITIPTSKFSYDVYLSVLNYSKRNEYRIPDYHRLDISYTIKEKPRKTSRYEDEWVFSVYNVYSRNNAYSITFDRYGQARKLSVLGSIFPSITYNFKF